MTDKAVIYHNPRCSKSRATLALLEQHELSVDVVEYLKTPPSNAALIEIVHFLGCTPREIMRTGQSEYRDNNLDNPELSDAELINAMVEHPVLIERPIVIRGDRAVIGRPPENVLTLL